MTKGNDVESSGLAKSGLACPGTYGSRARGFTLIELMIVVAVVAILAAIALPAYDDSVRKGRRGQAKADLVDLAQRAERFHTVNNTYVGFALAAAEQRSPRTGPRAFYAVTLGNQAANTFTLTATPQNGQERDARCMTLTLDQLGQKQASADPGDVNSCW